MYDPVIIGRNIRRYREFMDITRKEIVSQLDIGLTVYGRIERGECKVNLDRLFRIAECIGVDIELLLDHNPPSLKGLVLTTEDALQYRGRLKIVRMGLAHKVHLTTRKEYRELHYYTERAKRNRK